jgi:hypothetical protein
MADLVGRFRGERTGTARSHGDVFLVIDWLAYFVGALVAAMMIQVGLDLTFVLTVILLAIALFLAVGKRQPEGEG